MWAGLCAGSGIRVHLPAARVGTIAVTDIHDSFVEDALAGLAVGDFVRCQCLVSSGELVLPAFPVPGVCSSQACLSQEM